MSSAPGAITNMESARTADFESPLGFRRGLLCALWRERSLLLRIASSAVLGALIGLALPYTSRVAIDSALPDASPRLLVAIALSVLLLIAHQAWSQWVQGSARIALAAAVEKSVLKQALGALLRTDFARLEECDSGWAMTTLRGASSAVARYVDSIATLLTQSAFGLAYFAVLAEASAVAAGFVVLANAVLALGCLVLARIEASHMRAQLDHGAAEQQFMHGLLLGLASLRASFATERLSAEWGAKVDKANRAALQVARTGALQSILVNVGGQALATGLMVWAVYQCFEAQLSVGGMIFLIATSGGLSSAMMALAGVVMGFEALRPQFERVDELLAMAPVPAPDTAAPITNDSGIIVNGVWFRYSEGSRWVVENHCRVIRPGEVVHLRTPSGSGKSTLLRLIAGLLVPTQGKVTVFGVDAVRARELVLYVPQHCGLFEASIRENLELLSGATRAEIARVAQLTGLARMLEQFPMGEETLVAAQGQNLSSGQRQLIVLTAAFASSRPVLLLDEATSQIDAETRGKLPWEALIGGRTVVRVEHG